MIPRTQLRAEFFLVLACLGWGINYPLMKMALQLEQGVWVLAVRFALSAIIMLPLMWLQRRHINAGSIKIGLILGLILLPSVELMNWGLHYTSSSNAGFIFALCIIWVPVLNAYLSKTRINNQVRLSMLLGVTGLAIVAQVHQLHFNFGDLLILMSSFLMAVYILVIDRYGNEYSGTVLTTIQLLVLAIGCSLVYAMAKPESHQINWSWQLLAIILASCLMSSIFGTWAQTRFQADTTPDRATLIFNLEPIFATIFAAWWLHEAVGSNIIVGGGFIFAAILIPTLIRLLWRGKASSAPSN